MLKQVLDILEQLDDVSADVFIQILEENEENQNRVKSLQDELIKSTSYYYKGKYTGSERIVKK